MEPNEKINILVVDDVPEKLLAFQVILEELGQNVVTANSGREALRRLLNEDFAVILLDVNMPGMDGFETAALIRQRKRTELTPIIFITAYSDETHASQGYSLGAVDYILTPVVPEVLRAKVAVFVELYRKNQQVKRQAEERVILAQEQAAREAAEEATRRSAFLAEASKVLSRQLDYEATIQGTLHLVVPHLADVAVLTLVEDQDRRPPRELAWADAGDSPPVRTATLQQLPASWAEAMERAIASEESQFLPELGLEEKILDLPEMPANGHHGQLCLGSAYVVPLLARGRTLGSLLLAVGPSGRRYNLKDRAMAEDLVGRAAIALDNARLVREIQEGDRRKDEFLAMLGHELRNPLAAIANALACLDLGGRDGQIRAEARAILDRQVHQMARLVDDLLDVSRITRGKVELRKEPVALESVVDRAVASAQPWISARQHELSVSMPPDNLVLLADPARLEQILANLLNNAAKYTEPRGRIWLSAQRQANHVLLKVRDTGIGIPQQLLPRVFDLFIQGDRSLDRSQGGLGIGLTLVRSLVELHGGTVEVHSPGPQQGSEFVVRLPLSAMAPPPEPPPPAAPPDVALPPAGRRVLVVDDNVDLVTTTSMLLRKLGHKVYSAHDGPSAIEAAAACHPQVILVDIGLPGMNGYDVARHLRQRPGFHRVLLVAMTGYGQQEDRQRSRDAGFDHHLVKPVRLQELQALLTVEPALPVE
jgi:signal transduction histidine kinase/DNA-binding response OmpR family regulator